MAKASKTKAKSKSGAKSSKSSKSKSSKTSLQVKDLMPSGTLKGGAGSYAERMSMDDFRKLSEHWIEMAKGEAEAMGIALRPSTSETNQKVRRIVKASGFHFSETKRHVEVGVHIAATALAMLGAEPEPINLQSLLTA
jgi:hypothetical protein